jgi:hypothetical protein
MIRSDGRVWIEIKYQVGKKNIVADALLRRADHHVKLMKEEVTAEWLKK